MKYPRRNRYLVFKRSGADEFEVTDWLMGQSFTMNAETAGFLFRLDGRHDPDALHPGRDPARVSRLLREFRDCGLLEPTRRAAIKYGLGSFIYPLIYFYPRRLHRQAAGVFNTLLMLLFVPGLLLGLYVRYHMLPEKLYFYSKAEFILAMLLGLAAAMVLHELSHACAGLAYRARIYSMGVGTHLFIPMAFILMDDSVIGNRFRKAQANLAGIEMNLLLYGVFICLAAAGAARSPVFYMAGLVNLITGLVNLAPLRGLDGLAVISALAGKEDLLASAVNVIRRRKEWLRLPQNGKTAVIASTVLIAAQIGLPLLLVCEVYGIITLIRL